MAADDTMAARDRMASMAVSRGFREFVVDQLSGLGEVRTRAMFGGVGLYLDDLFFGLLDDDTLYLKADDGNRALFEKAGSRPFRPSPDRPETMQYYDVPLRVLEDVDALTDWAKAAIGAAHRKGVRKAMKRR
jgi:DNA transformation protein and related proteins